MAALNQSNWIPKWLVNSAPTLDSSFDMELLIDCEGAKLLFGDQLVRTANGQPYVNLSIQIKKYDLDLRIQMRSKPKSF